MLTPTMYKLVPCGNGHVDPGDEPKPIEDLVCDAVILSAWNVEDDAADTPVSRDAITGYDESGEEVYWGFHGVCRHQLFPTETTYMIPVGNAHDVSVRCSTNKSGGEKRVFWSAFKYVRIEDR